MNAPHTNTAGFGATVIDPTDKALWPVSGATGDGLDDGDLDVVGLVAQGRTLFDGAVAWPAMVLRESALQHNIDTFATFCRAHGLDFAPHGKTTLAPALFERQLAAGAWGITVATASQANVAFRGGVNRVLIANEVLDVPALTALGAMLAADPERRCFVFVDSIEGVRALSSAGDDAGVNFGALVDVGWAGGRTGVRGSDEALAVAAAVADAPGVTLAGVGSYEGGLPDPDRVRAYFAEVREIAEKLFPAGAAAPEPPIVTAGGSAYFDLVASELADGWDRAADFSVVLRSGAYISHDDGVYVGKTGFIRIPQEGELVAALEVWSQVTSAPEPGLVILGMGRRDAPYDSGMPNPLRLRRAGGEIEEDISGIAHVSEMDDQHGYLRVPAELNLRPGDLVCAGISHPCTAFDKWRSVPVVDDANRIIDVVRTYF